MADSFQLQVVATLLEGSSTQRTKNESETISSLSEEFWITSKLAGGASMLLDLGSLTDPKVLIVFGGDSCWVKLDALQAAHFCDPFFIDSNVHDGLDLSSLYIGNDDNEEHTITVIAMED